MHSNSPHRFHLTRVAALAMVAVAASFPRTLCAEEKPDITVKVGKQTEAIVPLSLPGQTTQRLKLEAEGSLEIKTSYIKFKDDGLWSRTSATKNEHIYRLLNAYSSQEFVHIDGEFVTPKGGGNGGNGLVPEFHVTVPAVDIDWTKVDGKNVVITEANEDKESGSIFLNNQSTAEFEVSKPSEYRDDMFRWKSAEKNLDMRFRWNDSVFNVFENNRLLTSPHEIPWESWPDYKLKDKGKKLVKNYKISVNSNATFENSRYPITLSSDNGASDVIYCLIVGPPDLDVDSNYDGNINDDDDPIEESQGGLVCVLDALNLNLTPIIVRLPAGTAGLVGLNITEGKDKIRIWEDALKTRAFDLNKPIAISAQEQIKTYYIEGLKPSDTPRDVQITLQNDRSGETTPYRDTIRLTVVKADLDVDANHDNVISDVDDLLEESVGGFTATNTLCEIRLAVFPGQYKITSGGMRLSAITGGDKIKVWADRNKATEIPLEKTWGVSAFPSTIYVEGIKPSDTSRDIQLRLCYTNKIFSCRDEIRMTSVEVEFVSMCDTYNPANKIFNPTPKDEPNPIPLNKLYLVEAPVELCYQVKLNVSCKPHDMLNKIVAASYRGGTKSDGGDSRILPDGTTTLIIPWDAMFRIGPIDYEIKVGFDWNNNNFLEMGEVTPNFVVRDSSGVPIGLPIVRGSDTTEYEASFGALFFGNLINSTQTPHAYALLSIFLHGNTLCVTPRKAPTSTVSVQLNAFGGEFSEWLTHNAGAPFSDEGLADISEHRWAITTELSNLIAESSQIEKPLTTYYNDVVLPYANSLFASLPVGSVVQFPTSSGSYDIPHKNLSESKEYCTIEFNEGSLMPAPRDDLFSAIARARLVRHKATYTVEKQSRNYFPYGERLVVTEVKSWGEIEDLYDFNQEAGALSMAGAIVQLGYGNGRHAAFRGDVGKIYRTNILFEKTYKKLP